MFSRAHINILWISPAKMSWVPHIKIHLQAFIDNLGSQGRSRSFVTLAISKHLIHGNSYIQCHNILNNGANHPFAPLVAISWKNYIWLGCIYHRGLNRHFSWLTTVSHWPQNCSVLLFNTLRMDSNGHWAVSKFWETVDIEITKTNMPLTKKIIPLYW